MNQAQLQAARRAAKTEHATTRQVPITADPVPVDIYVWPAWLNSQGFWQFGSERKITDNSGGYTSVHLSFNDSNIVYSAIVAGYNQIFTNTVPADGLMAGQPLQLTGDAEHHWLPHISPDGSKIAFTKFESDSNGDLVCVINNAAGAHETCLDFSSTTPVLKGANIWHASWVNNGKIVFEAWGGPLTSDEIFTVNPDGSGLAQITSNAGTNNYDECPSISNDGTWMVVDTWNDTTQYYEINEINFNTKERMTYTSGTFTHGDAWDPLNTYYTTVWVSQLDSDHSPQLYYMSYSDIRLTNNSYGNYFESGPQ